MKLWVVKSALTTSDAVKTASLEELRTLISVIAHEGEDTSIEKIAKDLGVMRSRVAAALALFTEDGIITESAPVCEKPTITEEFEGRLRYGELLEVRSLDAAKTIHDEDLASLIDELTRLMKRHSLSSDEVKMITALVNQYGLSPEFILLLSAHIASTSKLAPAKLRDEAIKLSQKEVTTLEELEKYIETASAENDTHREFRRILGIYGRALSPSEKKMFTRWGLEFGFGTAIVSEAYDMAALYAKGSMKYMDKVLTAWHEAGCKTVAECKAQSESHKNENAPASEKKTSRKKEEPKRYGDFDVNEAFERALLRSYGEEASKNEKGDN